MMTRALPALVLVAVVGCDCSTRGIEGTSDMWTEDVQPEFDTEPAEDPILDPGHEEASDPLIDEPEPDPIEEPVVDPLPEPDCYPGTEHGVCNLIDQCGCGEGSWCEVFLVLLPDETVAAELCKSWLPGTLGIGEVCRYSGCDPGLICWGPGMSDPPYCYQWCRTTEDCSVEGAECSLRHPNWWARDLPYKLCTLP